MVTLLIDTPSGQCPHLIIAAGFSGHGFKFCSLVGRILADIASAGTNLNFDLQPFRLDAILAVK